MPQPGLDGRCGYQPRGRGLGGSSAINAMLYVRGHASDYDAWAALGCTGWAYDDVLPWFRRSEANVRGADAWHGGAGPLWVSDQRHVHPASRAFVEAAASLQIPVNPDFNGATQAGVGLYQVTQKDGERWTSARAFLTPRPNLSLLTGTSVERVLFDAGRASGVACLKGGRRHIVRARAGVVLAGGAFVTPQLLMLSGIGPARHLADHGITVRIDRGAVGADLQDHIDYVATFACDVPGLLGRSLKGSLSGLGAMARWFVRRTGPMTTPFAEAGGFLATLPDLIAPDVQLHFVISMVEDHGRAKLKGHGYSCHVCVLRPESRGAVRLAGGDVRTPPRIDPAFLSAPADLATLVRGVRAMYRILEAPAMRALGGRDRNGVDLDDTAALERMIRARADTVYHPVGTARMGADAAAVCTPRLAVRGVDRLWIADASIMPRLIGGNTNAPTIMIGERCAGFIATDLR